MESETNNAEATNPLEEPSLSMVDVLQEVSEFEEEYAAVLGGSDEKCCTYAEGAIKRQALYSCLTCCPEARTDLEKCAGICLACSYRCHENHELVELYTKRNFRCDCPTERFPNSHRCVLNASLDTLQSRNAENLYNQNFQGVYCTCHRPYPDPERTVEEIMLQCAVCEDWFHLQHLDVPPTAAKLVNTDAYDELICGVCMMRHSFLQDYTGLSLKSLDEADDSLANITVTGDTSLCEDNDNKLRSDLDKSISDIMNISEAAGASSTSSSKEQASNEEPVSKRQKLDDTKNDAAEPAAPKCRRPKGKGDYEKGATFWGNDWRLALCQCADCMDMYKTQKIEYLLDAEDSVSSYEERGKRKSAAIGSTYEQGLLALSSIGHVQQIEAIIEYNRMKDKLKDFLQTFAVSKKVVTEADINRFFEEMRNEKNATLGQPYFCR